MITAKFIADSIFSGLPKDKHHLFKDDAVVADCVDYCLAGLNEDLSAYRDAAIVELKKMILE